MARPQRNNVDYFPFYCEEGKKMYYLEETYGNDGFAVFTKLLRELAKTDYHYLNLSKNTTLMFLSAKCKVSKDVLECIINDLVELEKFNKVLWVENKIIWCQDFIDSIQDAYSRRSNNCITYNSLLDLLISLGIRKPIKNTPKQPKLPLNDDVNPQSIVENSIVENIKKEIKGDKSPHPKIIEERSQDFYKLIALKTKDTDYIKNPDELRNFFEYWTECGDNDKKMRFEKESSFSVVRRLKTWWKNKQKFNPDKQSAFDNIKS